MSCHVLHFALGAAVEALVLLMSFSETIYHQSKPNSLPVSAHDGFFVNLLVHADKWREK